MTDDGFPLMFDAIVEVVCDNEKHRGRVRKVARFVRLRDGGGWLIHTGPGDTGRDRPVVCKLCGRGLPAPSQCGTALAPALNIAATRGQRTLTLRQLAELASGAKG